MTHDTDNPFAPPGAVLSGAPPEAEFAEEITAPPTHRLVACILGLALGWALITASSLTGEIIATQVGIAATFTVWEPMDYAPGAAFLLCYAPYALRRLTLSGQTLPFRILGLRFAKPGGGLPEVWRILLLHGLPTALVFWVPFLAASGLRLGGPLEGALRFSGLLLLCVNALSSWRASGRTLMDGLTGLIVVKA